MSGDAALIVAGGIAGVIVGVVVMAAGDALVERWLDHRDVERIRREMAMRRHPSGRGVGR